MYMPYLMYGYAATLVLMMLGCHGVACTVPGLRGLRLLAGALGCGLVTVILFALRPVAPAWLTIVVANQTFFACSLLIYCSLAEILAVPMRNIVTTHQPFARHADVSAQLA